MEYGYGVILSQCSFVPDADVMLLDKALDMGNDEVYHKHTVFCDNYGYSYKSKPGKKEFVETYEDDYTGCGLVGMLARMINDADFDGEDFFVAKGGCLYVKAEIPVDDEDKQLMPTQRDIQMLLSLFLNPLLVQPCSPCHVEVLE